MHTLVVPISLLAILFVGYHSLFLGHSFFAELDHVNSFFSHAQNAQSQGWRPDIGLGSNGFLGDPGFQHAWGLFRWWHHLFSDPVIAYNFSIIGLLWMACLSQYFLLRKAVPDLGRFSSTVLAPMIAFGSLQNEFFFQRHWILLSIATAIIPIILCEHLKQPSPRNYFLYCLILFASLFLGSSISLFLLIVFSCLVFFIIIFYEGVHRDLPALLIQLKRFILLNLASGVTIFALGAWVFYSIFLEQSQTGYIRDIINDGGSGSFFASLSPRVILNQLFGYTHAGILSHWAGVSWLGQTFNTQPWNMVSPLLPIVLLLSLFYKSRNFWEFTSKCIVFGFFVYQEVVTFCPGILEGIQAIVQYPPSKFHPVIQVYEIVMIGILLRHFQTSKFTISLLGIKVTKIVALFISMIYAVLLIASCMAILRPQVLESILYSAYNWSSQFIQLSANSKNLLPGMITGNIRLYNETIGPIDIIFYGLTFILIVLFVTPYWPNILKLLQGRVFASLLLVNSLFLSWSVYPLNKEPLIWSQQKKNGGNLSEVFEPTDRIAKMGTGCDQHSADYVSCATERYFMGEFGPRHYQVGYGSVPALHFSSASSFTQKDVAALMDAFMRREGKNAKGYRREMQTFTNFFPSKLYDFSAVNYFISVNRYPEHEQLELVHASRQFYLYRNLKAWPYYYLADRTEFIESYDDLYEIEKDVAYFWKDSVAPVFPEKSNGSKGRVELEEFEFGDMVFLTASEESEILVISDAWHPYWKAAIDGKEASVIKTNGVFKGVVVPPGSHRVRLFFDTTPYRPGIWISIASWAGFIASWFWIGRRAKIRDGL